MIRHSITGLLLAGSIAAGGVAVAAVPESDDPIKVIMNDRTGHHFSTKVAGALLQEMGYNIEYVPEHHYNRLVGRIGTQ